MNLLQTFIDPAPRPKPIGFRRQATCWMLEHAQISGGAGILLWLALCVGVFRWGMNYMGDADQLPPGMEWLGWVRTWGGWALSALNISWLVYAVRRCDGEATPAAGGRPERPTLASMMHGRIHERQPVRKDLLPELGVISAVGVGLGVMLTVWLALAMSGGDLRAIRGLLVILTLLSLATAGLGTLMLREVFFLANEDYFIAGREEQVMATLAEKQRKEAESDRDYQRKTVRGWPFWVLYGGFLGGLFCLGKFLNEPEGIAAFQMSVSALLVTAVWVYTGRLRPYGWRVGRGLIVVGAVAFLVFTVHTWGLHWLAMGLGLIWGSMIGFWGTRLYLWKLAR